MSLNMSQIQLSVGAINICFVFILSMNALVNSFPNEISNLYGNFGSGFRYTAEETSEKHSAEHGHMRNNNIECECENGECRKDSVGFASCVCLPEFGKYTEHECKACECGKGYNCTFDIGFFNDDKYCICPYGQEKNGPCKNINACASKPCQNNGVCSVDGDSYKCKCKSPFEGKNCTEVPDPCVPNLCKNNGVCKRNGNEFTCDCGKNYYGDRCEKEYECKNGEYRKDNDGFVRCFCLPEFGKYTEHECRACECGKGYNCTFDIGFFSAEKYCICPYGQEKNHPCRVACSSKPCQNNGLCTVEGYSYKCKCASPWSGKNCTEDLCASNPCRNNGICVVENGTFSCYCRHPFYGKTCEQEYNPTTDPTAFISTTNLEIRSTRNISWDTTLGRTFTASNFTNGIEWTTNQPTNFTNYHNLTTAEQWNITVGTTLEPSKDIFTSDSNVTSVSNQTVSWNITEDYRTTKEPSNYTQYQTSERPQNFTVEYTKTTDFKDLKTGRPIDTTLTDITSTPSTVPTSKPGAEFIFRNVYTIRNLTEIIIKP